MKIKREQGLKQAFSLLELIFVIFLLSLISFFALKQSPNKELDTASNRLLLYIKQTQLQSYINDKFESANTLWHKQRWTLKFFQCRKSVGGIYYSIYSDTNQTGHPSSSESLKDPLTNKNIYSSNYCAKNEYNSEYVLLTQEYHIKEVYLSCNSTSSLGQISFGSDGRVYSRLSNEENEFYEYEIKKPCILKIVHENGNSKSITIENQTGYVYKN